MSVIGNNSIFMEHQNHTRKEDFLFCYFVPCSGGIFHAGYSWRREEGFLSLLICKCLGIGCQKSVTDLIVYSLWEPVLGCHWWLPMAVLGFTAFCHSEEGGRSEWSLAPHLLGQFFRKHWSHWISMTARELVFSESLSRDIIHNSLYKWTCAQIFI